MDKDIEISKMLMNWYNDNKRELPWRQTTDPYKIWISEIILQQTRVAQGLDYYIRFINRFPTIELLAEAKEEEVLKYWQGLGYYSRARNLHATAQTIVAQFGGVFPSSYENILSLRGIGEYTAAAIVSFAWNMPYPVVDGNVFRVLSRLFGLDIPIDSSKGKKEFSKLAYVIMDEENALLHNQAIMDFGALVCTPQTPSCQNCPFTNKCIALAADDIQRYPVKQHKTKSRDRFFHYFHIERDDFTYLYRRNDKDIWKGLFEFPLIETDGAVDFSELMETSDFKELFLTKDRLGISLVLDKKKHVLSHQVIYATFYRVKISDYYPSLDCFIQIKSDDLQHYAIPRLIHIYLEKLDENFAN